MNQEKRKAVVYLSGPITGHEGNYHHDFRMAERLIEDAGFVVVNPSILPWGLTERDYMSISHAMLDAADIVVALKGWTNSQGCQIEWAIAQRTGKRRLTLAQFCEEYNVLADPAEEVIAKAEGCNYEKAG